MEKPRGPDNTEAGIGREYGQMLAHQGKWLGRPDRVWPKPQGRNTIASLSPVLWNWALGIIWIRCWIDSWPSQLSEAIGRYGRWWKENVCSSWKLCCSSGAKAEYVLKPTSFWSCTFRTRMWQTGTDGLGLRWMLERLPSWAELMVRGSWEGESTLGMQLSYVASAALICETCWIWEMSLGTWVMLASESSFIN